MPTDRREGWLKELKVGDEVARSVGYGREHRVARIFAITPSGRIRFKNGEAAPLEYSARGRMGEGWNVSYLYPVTNNIRDEVRRRVLIARITDRAAVGKLQQLSTERLAALWEMIKSWELG